MTHYIPYTTGGVDYCVKVQLIENGGVFAADGTNPNCRNSSYTDSIIFSRFNSRIENKAFFVAGNNNDWDGHFILKEDGSKTISEMNVWAWNEGEKNFVIEINLPPCS